MAAVEVTCALDWHINTNHAGFVAAQHQQYYAEEGIQCALREPSEPYTPPAELVRSGAALFCVAPSETVISSNTQSKRPPLQAVATILQSDSSAIATLASSGLDRPRKLDGKRYASYAARCLCWMMHSQSCSAHACLQMQVKHAEVHSHLARLQVRGEDCAGADSQRWWEGGLSGAHPARAGHL